MKIRSFEKSAEIPFLLLGMSNPLDFALAGLYFALLCSLKSCVACLIFTLRSGFENLRNAVGLVAINKKAEIQNLGF